MRKKIAEFLKEIGRIQITAGIVILFASLVAILACVFMIAITGKAEGTYKIDAGTYLFNDVATDTTLNGVIHLNAVHTQTISQSEIEELNDLLPSVGITDYQIPVREYAVSVTLPNWEFIQGDGYWIFQINGGISTVEPYDEILAQVFRPNMNEIVNTSQSHEFQLPPSPFRVLDDVYVSAEFGAWFSANTSRLIDPGELTIQGSYMFKNDLTSYLNTPFRIPLNFTVNTSGNTYQYIAIGSNGSGDLYYETESSNVDWVYDELLGGWPNQDYRSINLNAPKVLTSEQYSIFKNLVVPLERVTPIRGKWVANDVLAPPSQEGIYGSTIDLKFTAYIQYASANVLCYADQITLFYTDTTVDMFYRVINSTPDLRGYGYQLPYQMQVVDDNSFVSSLGGGTKYIDFGEQEQYVPTPFYNWFTVNFSPQPIYDKDQSDNIKDEINSVPKPNVGQMEDVFSPEDFFDENDPTFLANMGMFKDILGNSIMLPIVSLVLIFGVISFVIFGKRG